MEEPTFELSDVFYKNTMDLDPKIWWPHYQFVLQSIVFNYPHHPNEISQKKMYEIIMNIPLWIPNEEMSNTIIELLNEYPVSSYLTNRTTFLKWLHEFTKRMRRRINDYDKKRTKQDGATITAPFEDQTYYDFIQDYHHEYLPAVAREKEYKKWLMKMKSVGVMISLLGVIGYFSWKEFKK